MSASENNNEPVVRSMSFAEIDEAEVQTQEALPNTMDILKDVPLTVSVELGRAKMRVSQILKLGIGSVIQLDKMSGEPVDILVNGKFIAKGEVVAVDDYFGVRILEVINK